MNNTILSSSLATHSKKIVYFSFFIRKTKTCFNILYLQLIICMSDRIAAVCVYDLKCFIVFDLKTFLLGAKMS